MFTNTKELKILIANYAKLAEDNCNQRQEIKQLESKLSEAMAKLPQPKPVDLSKVQCGDYVCYDSVGFPNRKRVVEVYKGDVGYIFVVEIHTPFGGTTNEIDGRNVQSVFKKLK